MSEFLPVQNLADTSVLIYNSVEINDMNQAYRQLASRLIEAATKDGKLNLDMLRTQSNVVAAALAEGDSNTRRATSYHMSALTIATREVLGIIPKDQWQNVSGDELTSVMKLAGNLPEKEPEPTHGLTCTSPRGHINPNLPLGDQRVKCAVHR